MDSVFGRFLESAVEAKDVPRLLHYQWIELYANTTQVSSDDTALMLLAMKSDKGANDETFMQFLPLRNKEDGRSQIGDSQRPRLSRVQILPEME